MTLRKDIKLLVKPYYWLNILLSISYVLAKRIPYICESLFSNQKEERCELDSRETEILFFLIIVIMIRTRKNGSLTMINYLTSSFLYTKIANLILWSYGDYRFGIGFFVAFVVVGIIFPEPTYVGPECVTYFRDLSALEDEINRDKRITWLVCFYTVWNPSCVNFAPVYASLSTEYHLSNLKFGKIDVGRFPEAAHKFHISDSSLSKQLPSVLLFSNGKEIDRRPGADSRGKLQKFFFSEDNIKAAFGLNNIYKECRSKESKILEVSEDTQKKSN